MAYCAPPQGSLVGTQPLAWHGSPIASCRVQLPSLKAEGGTGAGSRGARTCRGSQPENSWGRVWMAPQEGAPPLSAWSPHPRGGEGRGLLSHPPAPQAQPARTDRQRLIDVVLSTFQALVIFVDSV